MISRLRLGCLVAIVATAAACNGEPATTAGVDPAVDTAGTPAAVADGKPAPDTRAASGKVGGPVSIAYRIVGQPVIGQPLAIDLRVTSALGGRPVRVDYRIVDATALQLAESQSPYATVAASVDEPTGSEQVTVVPLREGRLYLNVAATVDTDQGSLSTVTAIPIQVGAAPADAPENGTVTTDENGESIRVLGGSDEN